MDHVTVLSFAKSTVHVGGFAIRLACGFGERGRGACVVVTKTCRRGSRRTDGETTVSI
jgi:hypothetical protein